jgi:hypothetical protein
MGQSWNVRNTHTRYPDMILLLTYYGAHKRGVEELEHTIPTPSWADEIKCLIIGLYALCILGGCCLLYRHHIALKSINKCQCF